MTGKCSKLHEAEGLPHTPSQPPHLPPKRFRRSSPELLGARQSSPEPSFSTQNFPMGTKGDPKTPHSRSRDRPAPPKDGTKVKSTGLKIIEIPGFLCSFLDQGRSRGAPKTPRGRSKDHKDSPRTPQGPPKTRKRAPTFRWFFAMFSNGFKTLGFSRILTPKSVSARSRPQNH